MQQGHVQHGEHQEPGGVEVGLHIDEEHASTRAPPGHRCKACKTYSCKLQLRRQRAAPEQCLGSRRCPHASWVPHPGGPRPGGSRACCRCPSWHGCTDAKSCAGALLLLWRASECRVLMAPPPPALGAAAATPPAAAAPPPPPPPAPSMPITESGAYLPITSGGWILAVRGDLYSPRFFLSYILKRCRKKKLLISVTSSLFRRSSWTICCRTSTGLVVEASLTSRIVVTKRNPCHESAAGLLQSALK